MSIWKKPDGTEVVWSNTTYYNDDDLRYIIERCFAVCESLAEAARVNLTPPRPGQVSGHWKKVVQFSVRYYSGGEKWGRVMRQRDQVNIRLARRGQLFGSDLESLAQLSTEEALFPVEGLETIAVEIMRVLILWDPPIFAVLNPGYVWGFSQRAALELVREEILPSSRLRIEARAKKGKGLEEALFRARDKFERSELNHRWAVQERTATQRRLKEALVEEQRALTALAQARDSLAKVEAKVNKEGD